MPSKPDGHRSLISIQKGEMQSKGGNFPGVHLKESNDWMGCI